MSATTRPDQTSGNVKCRKCGASGSGKYCSACGAPLDGAAEGWSAVVGQVAMHAEGTVTSPSVGTFVAHMPDGPARFSDRDRAMAALEQALSTAASDRARRAGVEEMRLVTDRDLTEIEIEGRPMFIEARLRVTAKGRPRIATG